MLKAYAENIRWRRAQRKGKMTKPKLNCLIQKTSLIESAEAIASNFGNPTGNKPEIRSSKKNGSFESCYIFAFSIASNTEKILVGIKRWMRKSPN